MLEANIESAGLADYFDEALSTDRVMRFKPAPAAYGVATDVFGVSRAEVLFVPFAPWDAAGAKWFGYETYWVNRLAMPAEELGAAVDGTGRDLTELAAYVRLKA
jgi:2-haloacid dehalogenase